MDTEPTTNAGDDQDGIAGDQNDASPGPSHEPDDWFEHPRGGPRQPRRSVPRRNWIVAGVGAVAIAAAAIFGVNAVSSGSSSITTQSGQTDTVATSTTTKVSEGATGAVSDIKVGDHLTVMGSGSSTKIAAQQITDQGTAGGPGGPPGGGNRPQGATGTQGRRPPGGFNGSGGPGGLGGGGFSTGTVASVNGSTITLKTRSGSTVTVTTSSTTKVIVVKTGAVGDLTVGEQVVVGGTTSNGTITATNIQAGTLPTGPGGGNGSGGPSGSA
jgi:hypothetical protein